jgi:hypothetical protein
MRVAGMEGRMALCFASAFHRPRPSMSLDSTLFALRLVQLVLAVPLLAILGQGVVWVLARAFGQPPSQNFFYRLLELIASPFVRLARLITPRFVPDARIPLVALSLLAVGYAWVMFAIAQACIGHGVTVAECLSGR